MKSITLFEDRIAWIQNDLLYRKKYIVAHIMT